MNITQITSDKKYFLNLLLTADEDEHMIDKYLERGEMFALYEGDMLKTVCAVTNEGCSVYEIKNIATQEEFQNTGCGKQMIVFLFKHYADKCSTMLVGTGAGTETVKFYEKCGFTISHYVKNFFTDNYEKPIFENGKQLVDMVYLKKELQLRGE